MSRSARTTVSRALPERVKRAVRGRRRTPKQPPAGPTPAPTPAQYRAKVRAAVDAFTRGSTELAWHRFADVPRRFWAARAMDAYVRSGLEHDRPRVLRELRALARSDRDLPPGRWYEALGPVYAVGESELASLLFGRFDAAVSAAPSPAKAHVENRDWMRRWIDRAPVSTSAPAVPRGRIAFGVLGYGHPGRREGSANIGDHVQTLASLGHLVRRPALEFTGSPDLVEVVDRLQQRVPERLRVDSPPAVVELLTIDRDASTFEPIPPGTWALTFGWHMHQLFRTRHDLPLHHNVQPIFISFHCSQRRLLTQDAVEYLRRHGPIGCRDWKTVDILLSMGVPAFFSGCMTTTVSTVFPDLEGDRAPADAPVAYVDAPADLVPEGGMVYKHSYDEVRTRPFVENLEDALGLLDTYRTKHSKVVTGRLHAYLPSRSIGIPTEFHPANPNSDPRFGGLNPLDDEGFAAMREGILAKLEQVFGAIVAGADRDEVYALWRDITADDVAAAERRRVAPVRIPPVADVVAEAKGAEVDMVGVKTEDVVDVVIVAGDADPTRTMTSIVANASRPVRFTFLGGPADDSWRRWVADSDAQLAQAVRTGKDPAFDVLALAHLLEDSARAVVIPPDAVVEGDVTALASRDLRPYLFAAPTVVGRNRSGFGLIHNAANRKRSDPEPAARLRRKAHQAHAFDFDRLSADVLVFDLEGMRATGFAAETIALQREFGLDLIETLNLFAGPGRAEVPPTWSYDSRVHLPVRRPKLRRALR